MLTRVAPFVTDLWKNRELLWQFTRRNFEMALRGSYLGLIWSFLNPLLMLGLYSYVFIYIFRGHFGVIPDETRIDYALGLFLALSIFNVFAEVLATSPIMIVSTPNFVKKVVFPIEILPAAAVGASLLRGLISLVMSVSAIILFGHGLTRGILWLPVIILPLIFDCLGFAWLVSALGVFVQDIGQFMAVIIQMVMWSSGIFYSANGVPPAFHAILRYNPLFLAIDMARGVALWKTPIDLGQLAYIYCTGLAICYVGHFAFRKLKPAFADVL